MSRVLLLLLLSVVAFGAVAFIALSPDLWEPWLQDLGLTRDDPGFKWGLRAALGIVVGLPLTALILAIRGLGSDRAQRDIHGYTVLKPKAGTRWFLIVASLFGAALFFGYPMLDPQAPSPWMFQAAGAFCLVAIPVVLGSSVKYDKSTISVSGFLGSRSVYDWSDLVDVREVPEMKHYRLTFRNGKSALISWNYTGVEDLVTTAREKLAERSRRP